MTIAGRRCPAKGHLLTRSGTVYAQMYQALHAYETRPSRGVQILLTSQELELCAGALNRKLSGLACAFTLTGHLNLVTAHCALV